MSNDSSADSGDLFIEQDSSQVRPALGDIPRAPRVPSDLKPPPPPPLATTPTTRPKGRPKLAKSGRRDPTSEIELDDEIEMESDRDSVDIIMPIPSLPPPALPDTVTKFAKYDVLGLLATGGMAELYLARESSDVGGQRMTVLKVLRQHLVDSEEFEAMFLREGRVAMQLLHPNICTTYEFGKWRGHFYIAMEYMDGATLRQILERLGLRGQPMPVALVLHVISRIAAALEYAHESRDSSRRRLGVVHRDVSPQNIMIRFDGVVKLLDFGVAKVQQTEEETRSDAIKGKFGYLAPEQAVAGRVDGRTDVFALGIVLFESLTGKRLYKRASEYDTLKAILEDPVPSIAGQFSQYGLALNTIVQKALAKKPVDRYQSAGEMQQAIEELLAQIGVTKARHLSSFIHPLFPGEVAQGPTLTSDETVVRRLKPSSLHPPRTSVPTPATKRAKWLMPAIAAAGLLVAGAIGFALNGEQASLETVETDIETIETGADDTEDEAPELEPVHVLAAEVAVDTTDNPDMNADMNAVLPGLELESAELSTAETADEDEDVDEQIQERRRARRARREERRNMRRNMRPGFANDPGF